MQHKPQTKSILIMTAAALLLYAGLHAHSVSVLLSQDGWPEAASKAVSAYGEAVRLASFGDRFHEIVTAYAGKDSVILSGADKPVLVASAAPVPLPAPALPKAAKPDVTAGKNDLALKNGTETKAAPKQFSPQIRQEEKKAPEHAKSKEAMAPGKTAAVSPQSGKPPRLPETGKQAAGSAAMPSASGETPSAGKSAVDAALNDLRASKGETPSHAREALLALAGSGSPSTGGSHRSDADPMPSKTEPKADAPVPSPLSPAAGKKTEASGAQDGGAKYPLQQPSPSAAEDAKEAGGTAPKDSAGWNGAKPEEGKRPDAGGKQDDAAADTGKKPKETDAGAGNENSGKKPVPEKNGGTESPLLGIPLTRQYTVLLVGDSLMDGLGLMTRSIPEWSKDPGVRFLTKAKTSTGLSNVSYWNWNAKLRDFMQQIKPDVVIFLMGANDAQGIVGLEKKKSFMFKSEEWKEKYRQQAENMIAGAREGGADVLWLALPVMGSKFLAANIPFVAEQQQAACRIAHVPYLETTPAVGGEDGSFKLYKQNEQGKNIRIRTDDKCHFTAAGYKLVLDMLKPHLRDVLASRDARLGSREAE
ncbi:MAG: DUF459 domain-containing protein [Mailhella sp.]|nr:DUF459 domain-containing protein [Mailhella sp.]